MTTVQQQIDFIQELRDKWDGSQRERIQLERDPETVAELLRDVQENLIAMKLMQLGEAKKVELCGDCNQPYTEQNPKMQFGICEFVDHDMCKRCAQIRIDQINNSTVGIP